MGIIKAAKLAFDYLRYDEDGNVEDTQRAVDGVDLDIQPGEFVAVLGHNGSGKSTLAKCINAINLPESGAVYVNGMDTLDENNLLPIREKVGMVFQNPDNQIVATIVEEDVAFALENMGVEPNEIRRRVDEALKTVGMYEYRLHAPHKLSGGQKQLISFARTLLSDPKILVLDEATSSIDARTEKLLQQGLQRLLVGRTSFIIAHRLSTIKNCDKIMYIDNKGIAECGTHDQLIAKKGEYYKLYTAQHMDE